MNNQGDLANDGPVSCYIGAETAVRYDRQSGDLLIASHSAQVLCDGVTAYNLYAFLRDQLVPAVIDEDERIHTADHSCCDDPTCPCHGDGKRWDGEKWVACPLEDENYPPSRFSLP